MQQPTTQYDLTVGDAIDLAGVTMTLTPAAALLPGDVTDVLGETLHIFRVDPVRPGWVRIIGRLGSADGPADVALTVPAEASAVTTRHHRKER